MSTRPPGFVSGAILTPRIAYILETQTGIGALRKRTRGDDRDLDTALNAIRWAAMQWAASVNGSQQGKTTEAPRPLKNWYTPAQIAAQTGVTEHAVRLAIREGRLLASKVDGRWQVAPADYATFRPIRR